MSTESKSQGAAFDFQLIGRIVRLARPYKKLFAIGVVLTILLTVLAPVRPLLVQYAIDHHIADKNTQGIFLFSMYILIHIILQSVVLFSHTYLTNLLGQNVIKDLRMRVYNYILSLNNSFFDKSKVGTLVTRSVSDVETISSVFSQGLISIIGDLAQLLVILVIMFITSWQLSLISLAVLPVLIIASEVFRRGVRKSFQQVRAKVSELNAFVQEQIVGMEVVQLFGKQDQEFEKFKKINRAHLEAYKKSIFHYAIYFPIVEILSSVALGLIIWWSAGFPTAASAGLITAFVMYIRLIFRPIRTIADRFNTMQMGMVSSERIFNLIDDQDYVEQSGTKKIEVEGRIEFKNVWFSYVEGDPVLKDVSFELEKGKSLAIVGATGAGKSSIISLITKLYAIQKGEILIDGENINSLDLKHFRSQVGVVLQDVFLFAGSIKDNIDLKNSEISKEQLIAAAKSIDALDFIESLESGWNYDVMERGSTLSVGQRQLISFIRAMASNPQILILDEATSSVDSETEAFIQKATQKLMHNRTSIVIAHRLSTVREADSIIVLDKGRVMEQGSHEELLAKEGMYFELYQKQFELI
ncbi:MAG: ABC transporter ATP-binding protein/permease [Bacteroidia bacterium]|nr:ABC transporter ATP-binding protein/permease [Bacteroidia bacterium]NNJ56556.1 ABC transporter ATP-binding protein [Bacteroidia bacterium]